MSDEGYLLDTNVLSVAAIQPFGYVAGRLRRLQHLVCTSIVVAAELHFGGVKSGNTALQQAIGEVLSGIDILPLQSPSDEIYAGLRADLEKRGMPIGANDMLIAAHALSLGCTLVTDNVREFRRVRGLKVENWMRR